MADDDELPERIVCIQLLRRRNRPVLRQSRGGSYFAQIVAPNPRAFQLENPPPFLRSEYLAPAFLRGSSGSVSANGLFAGAPGFQKNIDDAVVFNCASQPWSTDGCKTTAVSSENTAFNYDLTIWYPCTTKTPEDANCCFLPALGYNEPFYAWCSSIGSDSFIISRQIEMRRVQ